MSRTVFLPPLERASVCPSNRGVARVMRPAGSPMLRQDPLRPQRPSSAYELGVIPCEPS
jgi:hypothetical protein